MKNLQKLLLVIGLVVFIILAIVTFQSLANPNRIEKANYQDSLRDIEPESTPQVESEEIDQVEFEEEQSINEDNTLENLEMELNNTIILEEDFSDL